MGSCTRFILSSDIGLPRSGSLGPGKKKTKLVQNPHKDTLAKDLHTKFYQELPTDTRHSNIMYSLFFISLGLYTSTFIMASYNPSWIFSRHAYYL